MSFGFKARVKPGGAVWLALERRGDFEIVVNGSPLGAKPKGWWVDRAFWKLDLKGKLKKGANEIVLRTSFRADTGVEQMYLVGDFGVDAKALRTQVARRSTQFAGLGSVHEIPGLSLLVVTDFASVVAKIRADLVQEDALR